MTTHQSFCEDIGEGFYDHDVIEESSLEKPVPSRN